MPSTGVTVKDVSANDFIAAYAAHLKRTGKVSVPKWADIVKTAANHELAPYNPDWFYVRCENDNPPSAALARRLYIRQGTGVGAFRRSFGNKKRRGVQKNRPGFSSGNIIRTALQELEKINVVEKDAKVGRRVTQNGQRDLDLIAGSIQKE